MPNPHVVTFQQFRYQILPVSQEFQTDWLAPGIKSLDDLKKKKNALFTDALRSIDKFDFSYTEVTHKVLHSEGTKSVYRIGAKREIDRETKEFQHEALENWPSLIVIIDNDEDAQIMLIEKNPKVFQIPRTVAGIFEDNINRKLASYHLRCYIEPMFQKSDFWVIARRYEGKITLADFELVAPNMSNISGGLTVDLRKIHTHTNSTKTNIRLHSPPDNALKIEESDPFMKGLVDYASEGGGNITLKVRNLKRKISTKQGVKELSIDEMVVTSRDGKGILDAFKKLL